MIRFVALLPLCLLAAAPACAGDAGRPRLVPGSGSLSLPSFGNDDRAEFLSSGGFSLGALSAPLGGAGAAGTGGGGDGLAVGGYATYGTDWLRLSSSLRGGQGTGAADLTASQQVAPWGVEGVAAINLGYQWTQVGSFSLNPAQLGVSSGNLGQANDLSLSLSFTHDLTPAFSMGGFAAASRGEDSDSQNNAGLHFGAGLELKF